MGDTRRPPLPIMRRYPNPSGWVAWGVNPSQPGGMQGGSALVVKKNASAPSGRCLYSDLLSRDSVGLTRCLLPAMEAKVVARFQRTFRHFRRRQHR